MIPLGLQGCTDGFIVDTDHILGGCDNSLVTIWRGAGGGVLLGTCPVGRFNQSRDENRGAMLVAPSYLAKAVPGSRVKKKGLNRW